MKYRTLGGGTVLALVITALNISPAAATHPVVEGQTTCIAKTGNYDSEWRTGGDPGYPDATATVVSQSFSTDPMLVGDEYAGSEMSEWVDGPTLAPGESRTLEVEVQFDSHPAGETVTNSYTLTAPTEGCKKVEPPKKKWASIKVGKVKKCDPAKSRVFVRSTENVLRASVKRVNTQAWQVKAEAEKGHVFHRNGKARVTFMVNTRPSHGNCGPRVGS